MERKEKVFLSLWWLAVVYALFCVAHPFFIGCDCSDVGPAHTCGIVQYYASIGSVGWAILLPLGIYLFRHRESMLIFLAILAFLPLVCVLFLTVAPSLGGLLAGDLMTAGVAELVITMLLTVPLLP